MRAIAIWCGLAAALILPLWIAGTSPLLQWRDPVYIMAGLAGVIGLGLLLIQPLLANNTLPGLRPNQARQIHRWTGTALVLAVLVHVGGLWITSPPDVIDALTFTSPTPFSAWGVIAMWGVFAAALIATLRQRLSPRLWRLWHLTLGAVIVGTTILHAVLIEGTMGQISKLALCGLVLVATIKLIHDRKRWFRR